MQDRNLVNFNSSRPPNRQTFCLYSKISSQGLFYEFLKVGEISIKE